MIKIDFEIIQDGLTFCDALLLPNDHGLTDADIEALKLERFNNWVSFVNASSQEVID